MGLVSLRILGLAAAMLTSTAALAQTAPLPHPIRIRTTPAALTSLLPA